MSYQIVKADCKVDDDDDDYSDDRRKNRRQQYIKFNQKCEKPWRLRFLVENAGT